MPFFINWDRVLHPIVLLTLTRMKPEETNQIPASLVDVCTQNALTKSRRSGGRLSGPVLRHCSLFYCCICHKDVSVLIYGAHEFLRHYKSVKHSPRGQRLRLETPGWRLLDFEGNRSNESELRRQRVRIP